jgi:carboxypeptidase Taq
MLLDRAESSPDLLDDWQVANLREMRRLWQHANAIPNRLVYAFHRVTTQADIQWRRAVGEDNFDLLAPSLQAVVSVVRERAAVLGDALQADPYDALLDAHDPGRRNDELERIYVTLRTGLADLIGPVMDRQSAYPPLAPTGPVSVERQKALCKAVMERIGFPFHKGRLDESLHPFTEGTAEDIRVTARFDENNFLGALMGVLHETGHAMYDCGLPAQWSTQPVGRDRGMAIHESQALFLEMVIGRSRQFTQFCAPLAASVFGVQGQPWSPENLYRLATRVDRSCIRMDADEVTYSIHVMLRWELERDLLNDALQVRHLREAWNEKMRTYLNVLPESDNDGCLQDSHWPLGYFGYFPTYTMGQVIAAQLSAVLQHHYPEVIDAVAAGDFHPLFQWLNQNIYCHGAKLGVSQLLSTATGENANPVHLTDYLRDKYLPD